MTRKEKVQELVRTLLDLDESQQYADYLEGKAREQVRRLKLTRKDFKLCEEYDLEEWLDELGLI